MNTVIWLQFPVLFVTDVTEAVRVILCKHNIQLVWAILCALMVDFASQNRWWQNPDVHQQVDSALHTQSQPFSGRECWKSQCILGVLYHNHRLLITWESNDDASQSHAALNNTGLMKHDILEYW